MRDPLSRSFASLSSSADSWFLRVRENLRQLFTSSPFPFFGERRADTLAQIPSRRSNGWSAHCFTGHSRSDTLRNPASECSASHGTCHETWKRSLVPRAIVVFPTAGCQSVWASIGWQEWRRGRGRSATGKTWIPRAWLFRAACSAAPSAESAPGASGPGRCF